MTKLLYDLNPLGAPSWVCRGRINAAAKAILLSWVGLGPVGRDRLDVYARLLYPFDDLPQARGMAAHQSTCALTAMALLRALGVDHPCLNKPYAQQLGQAVADVDAIGRLAKGYTDLSRYHSALDMIVPDPGDGYVVRVGGADTGQTEHVYTVIDSTPVTVAGKQYFISHSVDGGQFDNGTSGGIQLNTRTYERVSGRLWARGINDQHPVWAPSTGRIVTAMFPIADLTFPNPARVPDDFTTEG